MARGFLDEAFSTIAAVTHRQKDPVRLSLATKMVYLEIVAVLDAIACCAELGPSEHRPLRMQELRDGISWREVVLDLGIPEAEARAHVESLVVNQLLWATPDGCLGLTTNLCLTQAHEIAMVRGWRFVPTLVSAGQS